MLEPYQGRVFALRSLTPYWMNLTSLLLILGTHIYNPRQVAMNTSYEDLSLGLIILERLRCFTEHYMEERLWEETSGITSAPVRDTSTSFIWRPWCEKECGTSPATGACLILYIEIGVNWISQYIPWRISKEVTAQQWSQMMVFCLLLVFAGHGEERRGVSCHKRW